jgi:hypothetical protein
MYPSKSGSNCRGACTVYGDESRGEQTRFGEAVNVLHRVRFRRAVPM